MYKLENSTYYTFLLFNNKSIERTKWMTKKGRALERLENMKKK